MRWRRGDICVVRYNDILPVSGDTKRMTEHDPYDLAVIGGGPAGYVAAIRAAQLGMRVACIEREQLGGICLNWGCIPTKTLLAEAEFYSRLKHDAADSGILVDNIRHDWQRVLGRSRVVVKNLTRGIRGLLKKHKVTHIQGHAAIASPGRMVVADDTGSQKQIVQASRILICTGAVPRPLPGRDFDGESIISYKQAMSLLEQPEKLIIVGAGAIGMEFAYFYNAFGTECTVIELLPRVLPNEDEDVSRAVGQSFNKQGITCRTSMKTIAVQRMDRGVEVMAAPADNHGDTEVITADKLLVAIGVQGQFDGLFEPDAQGLGIEIDQGHIKVDRITYQTAVPGIYAVGDVIGPPWLAHVASEEAIICVEKIAGLSSHQIDYEAIPACTYCMPQVASLGMTEQMCREQGLKAGDGYKVGKFPFAASGKAQASGHTEGFVKLITEPTYGEILGVHMVGDQVTELLAGLGLAKRLEATANDVIATMHAHPTLSEAIHEAALGTAGRMIHIAQ